MRLANVITLPEYRGRGYGTTLVLDVIGGSGLRSEEPLILAVADRRTPFASEMEGPRQFQWVISYR